VCVLTHFIFGLIKYIIKYILFLNRTYDYVLMYSIFGYTYIGTSLLSVTYFLHIYAHRLVVAMY